VAVAVSALRDPSSADRDQQHRLDGEEEDASGSPLDQRSDCKSATVLVTVAGSPCANEDSIN
jgi:hypothetical protein